MSADNTIYYRQMPDGKWHITMVISLYHEDASHLTEGAIDQMFREGRYLVADTEEEALEKAFEWLKDEVIVEYGVMKWPRGTDATK